jgi:hypothetical protein
MTFPVPVPKAVERLSLRAKADAELRKLVLAEEDDVARFRRRMHIHICLIGVTGGCTLLSVMSVMDMTVVVYVTMCLNGIQEFIDNAGKF